MPRSVDRSLRKFIQENPHVYDENGEFIDWKKEFQLKGEWLSAYYEEEDPQRFIRTVMQRDSLDTYKPKDELWPLLAYMEGTGVGEGLHTGRGTGLLKWTYDVASDGRPLTKPLEVYDDYKYIARVLNNRFALINLCTYFGRNRYVKNSEGKRERVSTRIPSECLGIAIDLDYVKVKQLERLVGKWENGLIPVPTYLVNSGAGVHLYYLFEAPVRLKDVHVQRYLEDLKRMLIEIVWDGETSLASQRQYQGIYQDMRVPGSWCKFGYKNKQRCKYVLKAYRTGEHVDLLYLTDYVDKEALLDIEEDGSLGTERLTLEECMERYPKWYERVVINGETSRRSYTQNRGLYEWWKDIISQAQSPTGYAKDIAHVGNRYFCMRVLFVMAYKAGVPFEEAYEDAMGLVPFMNGMGTTDADEFTSEDVKDAACYYEDIYVRWSNATIARQTGINVDLYKKTKRNGRKQDLHLRLARSNRDILHENWREGGGRPSKEALVKEWKEAHPGATMYACAKATGIDKKTVRKWW